MMDRISWYLVMLIGFLDGFGYPHVMLNGNRTGRGNMVLGSGSLIADWVRVRE